jgi:hypothetical protein
MAVSPISAATACANPDSIFGGPTWTMPNMSGLKEAADLHSFDLAQTTMDSDGGFDLA